MKVAHKIEIRPLFWSNVREDTDVEGETMETVIEAQTEFGPYRILVSYDNFRASMRGVGDHEAYSPTGQYLGIFKVRDKAQEFCQKDFDTKMCRHLIIRE